MDTDLKSLIEKYKSDLMKFNAAHPQQNGAAQSAAHTAMTSAAADATASAAADATASVPTAAADVASPTAPSLSRAAADGPAPSTAQSDSSAPAAPDTDPIEPRFPGFVPGPEPERPERPHPTTESPEISQPGSVPQPERPFETSPQPEKPFQTMPQPEMPLPPHGVPEVSPRNPVPEMNGSGGRRPSFIPTQEGTGAPAASDVPSFDPDRRFADRPMSDTCLLRVRVSTAREAAPIAGAHVEVTRGKTLAAQLITDENGNTPLIELDCVDRALSASSGVEAPYTVCDISVSADGFYPTKNIDVPLFGGVTTVQNVSMIPVAEFGDQGRVIRTDTPETQL